MRSTVGKAAHLAPVAKAYSATTAVACEKLTVIGAKPARRFRTRACDLVTGDGGSHFPLLRLAFQRRRLC